MFDLIGSVHSSINIANMCPLVTLPIPPTPLLTCPIVQGNDFKVHIQGGTSVDKRKMLELLNAVRNSDAFFERYFDFVLRYLPGFTIVISPVKEITKRFGNYEDIMKGAIFPNINTYMIPQEALKEDSAKAMSNIRHEMRHLFWRAMQKATFNNGSSLPYCYDVSTKSKKKTGRKKVEKNIADGDKRTENLRKLLFREGKQQTSESENQYLEQLRQRCLGSESNYKQTFNLNLLKITFDQVSEGKSYPFPDQPNFLLGNVKVLTKSVQDGKYKLLLEILDPLRAFVQTYDTTLKTIKHLRAVYIPRVVAYERDAYLCGGVPLPLLLEFYPEHMAYIEALTRQSMAHPNANTAVSRHDYSNLGTLLFEENRMNMMDKDQLDFLVDTNAHPTLMRNIKQLVVKQQTDRIGIDVLQFALETLLQRGQDTKEINRLLARLADKKGDGLNACRHFHRAFKAAADFSYQDYNICLKNLYKKGDFGAAKVICQKGMQQFSELKPWYEKIKQARRGPPKPGKK